MGKEHEPLVCRVCTITVCVRSPEKGRVGPRNKELTESNEGKGWEELGDSAGDMGDNCGEGECLFCVSLLPTTTSALPSLPGMLSHDFSQGCTGIAGLCLSLFPVVTLSFPWSPGSRKSCSGCYQTRRTRGWDSPSCRCGNRREGSSGGV